MTIKAFLKKLIAEREKAQKKDKALTIPAAVQADEASKDGASHNVPANEVHHSSDAAEVFRETSAKPTTDLAKPAKENGTLPTESQKDVPQQSIEVNTLFILALIRH